MYYEKKQKTMEQKTQLPGTARCIASRFYQAQPGTARYLEVLSGTQDAAARYYQAQLGTTRHCSQVISGITRHCQVLPPVAEAKVWDEVMALVDRCVPATFE